MFLYLYYIMLGFSFQYTFSPGFLLFFYFFLKAFLIRPSQNISDMFFHIQTILAAEHHGNARIIDIKLQHWTFRYFSTLQNDLPFCILYVTFHLTMLIVNRYRADMTVSTPHRFTINRNRKERRKLFLFILYSMQHFI